MLLLPACSGESGADPSGLPSGEDAGVATSSGELSAESLVIAQTAWLSVSTDGAVYTTFLDPDGRYRDIRDGEIVFAGSWEQNTSGRLCFAPDQGKGACWEHGSPGLNGEMRATNEDGYAIEVKRITYTPPPQPEEEAEGEAGTEMEPRGG
ncbi:MAG: hypothetical protein AAFR64_07130 [Pseudomonadota bacterium]